MIQAKAYAALDAVSPLVPFQFDRRNLRPHDVHIDIYYCGICHSDLHQARDEWGGAKYPMVPGHEIIGKVVAVGAAVTKFKTGDTAAVGVMIDSCRTCASCQSYMEQYCDEGMTGTYNTYERDGVSLAQGGYSSDIVTDERWVYHVAATLDMAGAAPLLCAGITTYSPLKFAGVTSGMRVGVIGLGGLGHMGVKFAASFGAEVSLISTSANKQADAARLGAHNFVLSTDSRQMKAYANYFDVLLDCVSANHNYSPYLKLLRLNGKLLVVGLPAEDPNVDPFLLIKNRRSITGSMIGGTVETQDMLDYCAEKNIVSDVEIIPANYINEAYERMLKQDVRYRFVMDVKTI